MDKKKRRDNFIRFISQSVDVDLTVGDEYSIIFGYRKGREYTLRVIRSTRKGINLLVVEENKLFYLGKHLYDRKWSGKEVPRHVTTFRVRMSDRIVSRMKKKTLAKEA